MTKKYEKNILNLILKEAAYVPTNIRLLRKIADLKSI